MMKMEGERADRIARNRDLVWRIATLLAGTIRPAVEPAELVGDGFIGLDRAARRFDPSREIPFRNYACRIIRGSIIDGIRQRDWLHRRLRKLGRKTPAMHSLKHAIGIINDPADRAAEREMISSALSPLPRVCRLVMHLYFREQMSLKQIGDALGLTEARICQIRKSGIARLNG